MNDNDKNNNDYIRYCPLCGRSESKAGRLLNMPGGFNICMDCLQNTMNTINDAEAANAFKAFSGFGGSNFGNFKGNDAHTNSDTVQKDAEYAEDVADSDDELTTGNLSEGAESFDDMDKIDKKDEDDDKSGGFGHGGFSPFGLPNIQFMNWNDLQNMMNPSAKVKDKKKKKRKAQAIFDIKDIPKPHIIKEKLDEFVVGQEHAKKVMSVAVYNHYKRILSEAEKEDAAELSDSDNPMDANPMDDNPMDDNPMDVHPMEGQGATEKSSFVFNDEVEIEKSNMLMIGPTGCGKTYLVKTLARLLDVPLAITDATSLTEAGYIGDDIESVVSKLLAEADNDVETAEKGIIFIDEIDKIAKKNNAKSRDVSGESVQQGLLKLLEGSDVEVPVGASSKNAMVPQVTVNTRNILFICGGAFPELEDVIKKRLTKKTSIGYAAVLADDLSKDKSLLSQVTPEDLREFGMIPEFIGRLPMIFSMEGLSDEMLVRILKEPKNAIIKQYEKLLLLDEVKLEFTDEALYAIAKKAKEKETGARALRSIIEEFMLDIMYEIPKDDNIGKVIITEDYICGKGGPKVNGRYE